MIFFKVQETPYYTGYYVISPETSNIPFSQMRGSWNVLPARLLNIDYVNYLRVCRDEFNVVFFGKKKKQLYLCPYYKNKGDALKLCSILNKIASEAYSLRV